MNGVGSMKMSKFRFDLFAAMVFMAGAGLNAADTFSSARGVSADGAVGPACEDTRKNITNANLQTQLMFLLTGANKIDAEILAFKNVSYEQRDSVHQKIAAVRVELRFLLQKYSEMGPIAEDSVPKSELARFDPLFRDMVDSLRNNKWGPRGYGCIPDWCASECYRLCGYDTLDDKVCWFSCYRTCCNGSN